MAANDDLLNRAISAINDGDAEALRAMLADDVVHHNGTDAVSGRDAVIEWYQQLRDQAGWRITPHASVSTDEWASAIHRNSFEGGSFEVTTSGRVRDGRIAELWTVGMPDVAGDEVSASG